ncbi:hypothetical protein ROHU_029168 [Labeo rohita]|uniref:Uncharacterized protein n=1 Tax=Labeo rohita TaxID=84645 RepID=A0A498LY73_LABRO|nr:hypothetical protein ROHU_029168 [Labeo rohita]
MDQLTDRSHDKLSVVDGKPAGSGSTTTEISLRQGRGGRDGDTGHSLSIVTSGDPGTVQTLAVLSASRLCQGSNVS